MQQQQQQQARSWSRWAQVASRVGSAGEQLVVLLVGLVVSSGCWLVHCRVH
jgi:hypothetical protein